MSATTLLLTKQIAIFLEENINAGGSREATVTQLWRVVIQIRHIDLFGI